MPMLGQLFPELSSLQIDNGVGLTFNQLPILHGVSNHL
jgi:hypothetical protein